MRPNAGTVHTLLDWGSEMLPVIVLSYPWRALPPPLAPSPNAVHAAPAPMC